MPTPEMQAGTGSVDALVSLLDSLSDDEVSALVELSAPEGGGEAPPEGGETAADEAAESPEQQASEAAAGTEQHTAKGFADEVVAAAEKAQDALVELEALVERAAESDDGDPKAVKKALKESEKVGKELDKLATKALKAADREKVGDAAELANEAKMLVAEIDQLLADAKAAAGAAPAAAPGEAPPEAPAAKKGAEPAKTKSSIWAQRMS